MPIKLSDIVKCCRTPLCLAMLVYYFGMATIGLVTPDNILRDYPNARDFADFMSSIVPQIDRIAALGIAPDVNKFYFSVLWAGTPIPFVISLLSITAKQTRSTPKSIWTLPFRKSIWQMVAAAGACVWGGYGLWYVDPSMRLTVVLLGMRLGRALMGQAIFHAGPVICAALLLVFVLGWLTGYIPRNIRRIQNG